MLQESWKGSSNVWGKNVWDSAVCQVSVEHNVPSAMSRGLPCMRSLQGSGDLRDIPLGSMHGDVK
jgi:hypothetical protein